MKTFNDIIFLFDHHLINGIFISTLVILLVRIFLKKLNSPIALNMIRWLLIVYAIGAVLSFVIPLVFIKDSDYSVFWQRITGEHGYSYWLMIIVSISPFLLLSKKLGHHIYFILFLSLLVNMGWLFESFVIRITSLHRDYSDRYLPWNRELIIALKGLIVGIIAVVIGNIISSTRKKRTHG